ncbi:MAG TPA: pilus assembly protein N-terminal domain-containing protein [Pirellulaceae bacterium]|nr:pilus assembly protein N-terminal domain-containing protein [Pirellulaceae bacterium]
MVRHLIRGASRNAWVGLIATLALFGSSPLAPLSAQPAPQGAGTEFFEPVGEGYQKLEMAVGTSRVLRFGYDIPKVWVSEGIVSAKPISPNEIMLQATRPGMASLYVQDGAENVQTIDIVVLADIRPLEDALDTLFPSHRVVVRPLNSTVVVGGYASSAEQTSQIMAVVRDFFPTPINQIQVDGNHTVLLTAKVFEVSRTKLKRAGIDWSAIMQGDFIISNPGNTISLDAFFEDGVVSGSPAVLGGVVNNGNQFNLMLDLLEQDNMAKVLADTQLVADSGRAASLLSGGRVPVPLSNGLATSIQFQDFGTSLDCVPIVQEDGLIRLEILAEVSDVAGDLRDSVTGTPGFRTRSVNTAVTVPAGKTIAIAGIIQNRTDAEVKGVPYLKDMPWVGGLFRRTVQTFNEVDLVVVIRPEFVGAVDPCEMPEGPGRSTVTPDSYGQYIRGHVEVPSCNPSVELGPVLPFEAGFGEPTGFDHYGPAPGELAPVPLVPQGNLAPVAPIGSSGATRTIRVEKLPETTGASPGTSRRIRADSPAAPAGDVTPELMGPMGFEGTDVSMLPRRQW